MTKTNDLNTDRVAPDSNIQGDTSTEQGHGVSETDIQALLTSTSLSRTNGPTLEAFNAAMKSYEFHQDGVMTSARVVTEMAGIHFCLHGDTSYMTRVLVSMRTKGKNFVRQAAYQKWLLDFFPVEIETSNETVKITKNKLREAQMWPDAVAKEALLEKALSTPFWEHAPDKEIVRFGKIDLLLAIKKTVEKFGDDKKYLASSDSAVAAQKAALAWIDTQLS